MTSTPATVATPSDLIDGRIEELGGWRGAMLTHVRTLLKEAVPQVVEEWKWRGVPTWHAHCKILCTGETCKAVINPTFAKGAAPVDPQGLFNSSFGGNVRRATDTGKGRWWWMGR